MPWGFQQSTGALLDPYGKFKSNGYSGFGRGKNNPAMQDVQGVGPLPVGTYSIEAPVDTPTHGPYVLRLTPTPDTETFGRSGFLIHGDSIAQPGGASHGCIIVPRSIREAVWASGVHEIEVTV